MSKNIIWTSLYAKSKFVANLQSLRCQLNCSSQDTHLLLEKNNLTIFMAEIVVNDEFLQSYLRTKISRGIVPVNFLIYKEKNNGFKQRQKKDTSKIENIINSVIWYKLNWIN